MVPTHSAPRICCIGVLPLSCTWLHSHRTRNSPASQVSRSRLVVIARAVCPVSGSRFADRAVRVDSCTTAVEEGCAVFMPCSVPAPVQVLNIQKPEFRI